MILYHQSFGGLRVVIYSTQVSLLSIVLIQHSIAPILGIDHNQGFFIKRTTKKHNRYTSICISGLDENREFKS